VFLPHKLEFAVIYADDGISGTNTKNVRTLTLLCISFQKRNSKKTINTVFSAEHDYPQYKKIKIRHFLQ